MNWTVVISLYLLMGAVFTIASAGPAVAETLGRIAGILFLIVTFPIFLGRMLGEMWDGRPVWAKQ